MTKDEFLQKARGRFFAPDTIVDALRPIVEQAIAEARDMTWFWEIVDRAGLAAVPSDEKAALARLIDRIAHLEQLRDGLQAANSAYLERARKAETEAAHFREECEAHVCKENGAIAIANYFDLRREFGGEFESPFECVMEWKKRMKERVKTLDRVVTDICDELGCAHDNEEALAAIDRLKQALVQARGALTLDHMVDDNGQPYGTTMVALQAIEEALSHER